MVKMAKKIKKRNGQIQDYAANKVIEGLKKAGAAGDEAVKVAEKVSSWIGEKASDGVVTSRDIGKKAIEYMGDVNEGVSVSFKKYFDNTPNKGKKTGG